MKTISHLSLCAVLLTPSFCVFGDDLKSAQFEAQVQRAALDRVRLLNAVLRNPKEATVSRWDKITGHHEHGAEGIFVANSISGGDVNLTNPNSSILSSVDAHLRNPSSRSIALGHLRLSLLAYNFPCGKEAPRLVPGAISSIPASNADGHTAYKLNLEFHVTDAACSSRVRGAEMTFIAVDTTSGSPTRPRIEVTLESLRVGENEHLNWWTSRDR